MNVRESQNILVLHIIFKSLHGAITHV